VTAAPSPGLDLPPGVSLRHLAGRADLAACLEVQQAVWGDDPRELVPPIILEATRHAGGLLGGACDGNGRLVGIVFGMPAWRDGRPGHWSHLLAVRPEARRLGLGLALKHWQRDRLREQGIDRAFWSYDPLLAANAHLNLNLLGARVIEYVEDMYGEEIQGTAGSDRFVVEWDLDAPAAPAEEDALPVLAPGDENLPAVARPGVAVPPDFTLLAASDPGEAGCWRAFSRRALQQYLALGYRVAGFRRGVGAHYVLEAGR
jgi:predicted GNAT superfamily acetyltransferase